MDLPGQREEDGAGLNTLWDTFDNPLQHTLLNVRDLHALVLVRGEFCALEAPITDDFVHAGSFECVEYTTARAGAQAREDSSLIPGRVVGLEILRQAQDDDIVSSSLMPSLRRGGCPCRAPCYRLRIERRLMGLLCPAKTSSKSVRSASVGWNGSIDSKRSSSAKQRVTTSA